MSRPSSTRRSRDPFPVDADDLSGAPPTASLSDWAGYARGAVRRRPWVAVVVFAAGLSTTTAYYALARPMYQAETKILAQRPIAVSSAIRQTAGGEPPTRTAEELIRRRDNLVDIVKSQQSGWGLVSWNFIPLFPMFLVYLISGVAETNRAPFDVAEGESEIVAGFHVEYSGIAFALFFLAEYANMIMIATLTATFFCGGWLSPFEGYPVVGDIAVLASPGLHWLVLKIAFFLFCFLWFRATFPRYRYDQIMRLGWKVFIPVTLVWLCVEAALWIYKIGPWAA